MAWILQNDQDKAIIEELTRESDRGLIIIGTSFLEARLEQIIKIMMPAKDRDVEGKIFSGSGPMATFSAKIDVGYLMQFYPAETRALLHKIRCIRNDAAHSTEPVTFETPTIKDRSENLVRDTDRSIRAFYPHLSRLKLATQYAVNKPAEIFRVLNDDGTVTEGQFHVSFDDARSSFLAAIKLLLFCFYEVNAPMEKVRLSLPDKA
ncbi:MAG: hypothetical protein VR78_16315 [Hoeflea sp. BRH_c9]|nr:MAG: hypothetical protein VR78_16315 [Hoeflea sp. BRH_c9]